MKHFTDNVLFNFGSVISCTEFEGRNFAFNADCHPGKFTNTCKGIKKQQTHNQCPTQLSYQKWDVFDPAQSGFDKLIFSRSLVFS